MGDFDVAFAISINADHIFVLIVLNQRCAASFNVEIILAFATNHGAVVPIGIEVILAVATDQGVFAVPGEDLSLIHI